MRKIRRGDSVRVLNASGRCVAKGLVESVTAKFVTLKESLDRPSLSFNTSDYRIEASDYRIEAEDDVDSQEVDGGSADTSSDGTVAPMEPEKPKSTLSDDETERVLNKVADAALTALKGAGLKSSALYPLMIKINTALKSALTN